MQIEIVSNKMNNTVSINRKTNEVTQIIRFPSGNFYKQTWQCDSYADAKAWARGCRE